MSIKIGTDNVLDERIDITVDGSGIFHATFNDQEFDAPTRRELLVKLQKAVRAYRRQGLVDVTVLGLVPDTDRRRGDNAFVSGAGVVQAKLRAPHEREYNCYLLVSDDGQRFKVSGYERSGIIARRLNDEEIRQYLALKEAVRVAETALEDFVGAAKIDPDKALRQARKKGGDE